MLRKPYYIMALVLGVCLVQNASAQNFNWSGAGDGTTWSQGANWVGGVVPPANNTTTAIFLGTGFPTTTPTPIVIGASDSVHANDQVFGPEWGETLNIYGTMNNGFGFAPVGAVGGPVSTVNLYGTSSLTTGDSIFIGDMFWFNGGPNIVFNMYDNSSVSTKYVGMGGHLNIYGGTMTVLTGFLTGTPTAGAWGSPIITDATRLINIAGGKLVVAGDITAQVNDLIARGILEGNGIVGNVNIDLLSDPGFTVITVPEPSSMALLGLGGGVLMMVFRRRS